MIYITVILTSGWEFTERCKNDKEAQDFIAKALAGAIATKDGLEAALYDPPVRILVDRVTTRL
jgi:hypothetical protein